MLRHGKNTISEIVESPSTKVVEDAMNSYLRVGSTQVEDSLSDEHSELEPPDPISNSEVKRLSADGSVGSPHVRVGHRQAFIRKRPSVLH